MKRAARLILSVHVASAMSAIAGAGCDDQVKTVPEAGVLTTSDAGVAHALSARAARGLDISPVALNVANLTEGELERVGIGSYLVNAVADCSGCHDSLDGQFLGGGTPFPVDGAAPPHVVNARNLTPDSKTGLKLSEAEFLDTMQTGRDHHAVAAPAPAQQLIVMPWLYFRWMAPDDLKAIYAYLRVIPAVANQVMPDNKGDVLAALPPVPLPRDPGDATVSLYTDGDVTRPLPPETDVFQMPAPDPDRMLRGLAIRPLAAPADLGTRAAAEVAAIGRGSYLVNAVGTCNECHTNPDRFQMVPPSDPTFLKLDTAAYLSGGRVFAVPPPLSMFVHQTRTMSADLTGATHGFLSEPAATFDVFVEMMATGRHVEDEVPTPIAFPMPWNVFRNMVVEDLEAIWTYLGTIPPRAGAADKITQHAARFCTTATVATDCPALGESCNETTSECVGGACAADEDCGACQTCAAGGCAAPLAAGACAVTGI